MNAERVRGLQKALKSAQAAEREYRRAGDGAKADVMLNSIERIAERLGPCPRGYFC
jgi:hypothetical protein